MKPNREIKSDSSWRMALVTVGIALSLPGTIAVPAIIGGLLDSRYGTSPTLLIIGFVLGLFSAAVEGYILFKRMGHMK
jgi:F0F1-type ATP synthase assembly protein I